MLQPRMLSVSGKPFNHATILRSRHFLRYDYDTLKKCEAPEEIDTLLKERVKLGEAAQKVSH